jgi:hypothetical protein
MDMAGKTPLVRGIGAGAPDASARVMVSKVFMPDPRAPPGATFRRQSA